MGIVLSAFRQFMTRDEEMKAIVKILENIFTIDGKGRPAKARAFMELVSNYGLALVLNEICKIGERKAF